MRIREIISAKVERPRLPRQEYLRLHRTVMLLELIGSEEAKQRLDLIAHGHADLEIARHAFAAIQRME